MRYLVGMWNSASNGVRIALIVAVVALVVVGLAFGVDWQAAKYLIFGG